MSLDRWIAEELPSNWATPEFSDFCDVVRGGSPRPMGDPRYFGGSIPFVKISDVTASDGRLLVNIAASVTPEGAKRSRLLSKGRLILSNSGTVCVPVFLGVDACIHDGFVTFDELPEGILPEFLYHFFNYVRPFLRQKHKQGVTQVNLNTGIVSEIPLPLPPLNEQKRIVAKIEELFSELDDGEESLRRARRKLGVYRQSLLKQAFEGKLTATWRTQNPDLLESPDQLLTRIQSEHQRQYEERLEAWVRAVAKWKASGETEKKPTKPRKPNLSTSLPEDETKELAELPNEWAWCALGSVCEFANGDRGKNYPNRNEYVSRGIPWINTGHIEPDGSLSAERMHFITRAKFESLSGGRIEAGDLVYCLRGATFGKTAFVKPYAEGAIASSLMIIRPVLAESSEIIYRFLLSPLGKSQLKRFDNGSAQPNLSAVSVGLYQFPLCSVPEQQEIVRLLDEQFTVIEQNEREIDAALKRSEALRQSILKKAFTGQLVPQDPTDEPATELLARIRAEREANATAKSKAPRKKKAATRKPRAKKATKKEPSKPREQATLDL